MCKKNLGFLFEKQFRFSEPYNHNCVKTVFQNLNRFKNSVKTVFLKNHFKILEKICIFTCRRRDSFVCVIHCDYRCDYRCFPRFGARKVNENAL